MPLWVSVVLALGGMIYFKVFWEAVALFLLSDLLFGVKEARLYGFIFVSFFVSLIIIIAVEIFKKKLKFYN